MDTNSEKKFNGLWVVLGLAGITIAIVVALMLRPKAAEVIGGGGRVVVTTNEQGQVQMVQVAPPVEEKVKPPKTITRRRLEPEATKRLSTTPQKIKMILTTLGRAEKANWGIAGTGSFMLTYNVECDAEILEKKETAGGEIRVVEKRTFKKCQQLLRVYETDVRFALYDTLPLKEVSTTIKVIGGLLSSIPATSAAGPVVTVAGMGVEKFLKGFDDLSARDLLKKFRVQIPDIVEGKINDLVAKKVSNILKTVNVEGKSYLITYYQDAKSGAPMDVTLTYEDGRALETEEEFLVLRRANAFLDAQVVPDKAFSLGDTWTVDTSSFECLMDPFVDGYYCGDVTLERKENDARGDWVIGLRPCLVGIKSDAGRTKGELRLTNGEASVDGANVFVKKMVVNGKGGVKSLTPHHLLFKARVQGDCEFQGMMEVTPIRK